MLFSLGCHSIYMPCPEEHAFLHGFGEYEQAWPAYLDITLVIAVHVLYVTHITDELLSFLSQPPICFYMLAGPEVIEIQRVVQLVYPYQLTVAEDLLGCAGMIELQDIPVY